RRRAALRHRSRRRGRRALLARARRRAVPRARGRGPLHRALPPAVSYDIHGVPVEVRGDAAVRDALDHRLRAFAAGTAAAGVRLEFLTGEPPAAPPGRPVYDTPHGSLHYDESSDTLWGELAGVHLRCADGAARFYSESFDGFALYLATHPLATISL